MQLSSATIETLLEQARVGVWETTLDHELSLSATARWLCGVERVDEIALENFAANLSLDDQRAIDAAFASPPRPFELDFQLGARTLRMMGSPLEEGRRVGGLLFDLTESKAREEELWQARSANTNKSDFLANMSHEMRTPLGTIIGFADLALDPASAEQERSEFLQIIKKGGEHLLRLIDELLDLSRIESDSLHVASERVETKAILHDLVDLMGPLAERKGLCLHLRTSGDVPEHFHTDRFRLKQILLNIVGNGIKFTDVGSVQIQVTAEQTAEGARAIVFEVFDTGVGILSAHQERLFQRYRQADDTIERRFGGSGLGLVLARRLARALGGDVTLKCSRRHVGSCFRVVVRDDAPVNAVEGFVTLDIVFPRDSRALWNVTHLS